MGEEMKPQRIIVQYILLRKDLSKLPNFKSKGAHVAQACHASTAAMYTSWQSPCTQAYFADLQNMTKMVLGAPNEDSLIEVSKQLKENGIDHILWKEQPEDIYTALAICPNYKDEVESFFKPFKLY